MRAEVKKPKYQENDVIEIEWVDTTTVQNWHNPNSKHLRVNDGLTKCKSAGFFLRLTEKTIQISQAFSDDGSRCNSQCIPLSTIIKIRRLK